MLVRHGVCQFSYDLHLCRALHDYSPQPCSVAVRSLYSKAVQFRLLGAVDLVADGKTVALPRPRSRAVLVRLLLSANRLVATDSLVDAIWGEKPPRTARNQVQLDVSALRRALCLGGLCDPIRTTSTGYCIELRNTVLGLSVFEELCRAAWVRAESGEATRAAGLLREALDLWRGPPLGDVRGAFVEDARIALTER